MTEQQIDPLPLVKSEEEHKYTSTGIKFWRHKQQMDSYIKGTGHTVISTHISPEGVCNLQCSYCSVSRRTVKQRIELATIKRYVTALKSRGLKAVILTGGGEPTLYPDFNELVSWIKHDQGLSVALITNGTTTDRVEKDVWNCFSWVRVSLNFVKNYQERIKFPEFGGTLGSSFVYEGQSLEELRELSRFLSNPAIQYVRVLPNCLLDQSNLIQEHTRVSALLKDLGDKRFFQQFKLHGTPTSSSCHQAYFRPYLSEVGGGTVYPCDSLVLNDSHRHFADQYAICSADQVLDFLDGKIPMKFDPRKICQGCVFSDNIGLLNDWKEFGKNRFDEFQDVLPHEEFV